MRDKVWSLELCACVTWCWLVGFSSSFSTDATRIVRTLAACAGTLPLNTTDNTHHTHANTATWLDNIVRVCVYVGPRGMRSMCLEYQTPLVHQCHSVISFNVWMFCTVVGYAVSSCLSNTDSSNVMAAFLSTT